ncbi:hypothetical protein [Streptomyces longwoodensis]|uniref:hypothetical protein n=1 Tax=Streptomyces longwoodensis TaxID=68231 RepID=UPI0033FAA92B
MNERLAVCKLEIPGTTAAEEQGAAEAAAIKPWTRSLRYLMVVEQLRGDLDRARRLLAEAEAEAAGHYGLDESDVEALRAMALAAELQQADSDSDYKLAPRGSRQPLLQRAQLVLACLASPDEGRLAKSGSDGRTKPEALAPRVNISRILRVHKASPAASRPGDCADPCPLRGHLRRPTPLSVAAASLRA